MSHQEFSMNQEKINQRTNEFIDIVLNLLKERQQKGYDLAKTITEIESMKI